MEFLKKIFSEDNKNYEHGYLGTTAKIPPDEFYLSAEVDSLWITKVRKLTKKFYGAIHGSATLTHEDGQPRVYQIFATLGSLKEMDPSHLEKVIQGPYRVLRYIPYRGGGLDLSIALFSVEAIDLARPYLGLLNSLSDAAGLAAAATVKPFVDILHKGVSEIIDGNKLEIGRNAQFQDVRTGLYAMIAAPRSEVSLTDLSYDEKSRQLLHHGKALTQYPYMVLKLSADQNKPNWAETPALGEALARLKAQIKATPENIDKNYEAYQAFEVIIGLSGDLIPKHADQICDTLFRRFRKYLDVDRMDADDTEAATSLEEVEHTALHDLDPFAHNQD